MREENLKIYFDESGNSGCNPKKKGDSEYFSITALETQNPLVVAEIKKAGRRTLKNKLNSKKNKGRIISELKGAFTNLSTKEYFFRLLPKQQWSLYSLIVEKKAVFSQLQTKRDREMFYNSLIQFLLRQIRFSSKLKTVHLVLDKCKNREEIKRFNDQTKNQLQVLLPKNVHLYIDHESSAVDFGLQAVDLFSWGIYRKYAQQDLEWYNIFKHHIKVEMLYSKKIKTAPLIPIS